MEKTNQHNEFVQLIEQHQGIVHKVCNMYADGEERKDLFQEILVQLWRSYHSFKKESKFTTWAYRVALNTAISSLRKKKRKPESVPLSTSQFRIAEQPIDYEKEERSKALHLAIKELTKIERGIILLHLEGYSYEEIGEMIGITKNHVGVKINRIKTKLKKIIVKKLA